MVLDLRYEARTIDQSITSRSKVDKWFDAKTKGMTDAREGGAEEAVGHDAEGAPSRVRPADRSTTSCSTWRPGRGS